MQSSRAVRRDRAATTPVSTLSEDLLMTVQLVTTKSACDKVKANTATNARQVRKPPNVPAVDSVRRHLATRACGHRRRRLCPDQNRIIDDRRDTLNS